MSVEESFRKKKSIKNVVFWNFRLGDHSRKIDYQGLYSNLASGYQKFFTAVPFDEKFC